MHTCKLKYCSLLQQFCANFASRPLFETSIKVGRLFAGELGKGMTASTAVMVSNVLMPSLAIGTQFLSTSTLAAVSKSQLMLRNEHDASAFGTTVTAGDAKIVPAKLFTPFGKLPSTPVCICVKR